MPKGIKPRPLATSSFSVLSPHIGAPSETFIRRHMELISGQTNAIFGSRYAPSHWDFAGPSFELKLPKLAWVDRALRGERTTERKKVSEKFHINIIGKKYEDFFESLTA